MEEQEKGIGNEVNEEWWYWRYRGLRVRVGGGGGSMGGGIEGRDGYEKERKWVRKNNKLINSIMCILLKLIKNVYNGYRVEF